MTKFIEVQCDSTSNNACNRLQMWTHAEIVPLRITITISSNLIGGQTAVWTATSIGSVDNFCSGFRTLDI